MEVQAPMVAAVQAVGFAMTASPMISFTPYSPACELKSCKKMHKQILVHRS